MPEQDLTLGLKLKPKTAKLQRPDGTYEIIDAEEERKHAENLSREGATTSKTSNKERETSTP